MEGLGEVWHRVGHHHFGSGDAGAAFDGLVFATGRKGDSIGGFVHRPGVIEETAAGLGQDQAAAGTIKNGHAQHIFEGDALTTQSGLGLTKARAAADSEPSSTVARKARR